MRENPTFPKLEQSVEVIKKSSKSFGKESDRAMLEKKYRRIFDAYDKIGYRNNVRRYEGDSIYKIYYGIPSDIKEKLVSVFSSGPDIFSFDVLDEIVKKNYTNIDPFFTLAPYRSQILLAVVDAIVVTDSINIVDFKFKTGLNSEWMNMDGFYNRYDKNMYAIYHGCSPSNSSFDANTNKLIYKICLVKKSLPTIINSLYSAGHIILGEKTTTEDFLEMTNSKFNRNDTLSEAIHYNLTLLKKTDALQEASERISNEVKLYKLQKKQMESDLKRTREQMSQLEKNIEKYNKILENANNRIAKLEQEVSALRQFNLFTRVASTLPGIQRTNIQTQNNNISNNSPRRSSGCIIQ